MRQNQLYVMVKEPRTGRVKTRLGRDIGLVQAAWWFRHQVTGLLRRLSRDPRWQTVLAVAPDSAVTQSRVWPPELARVPQGFGDLGDRMRRVFAMAPLGPAVIIGGDIPGITPDAIAEAFTALGSHDVVFGPAPDGGYWLVGLARSKGNLPDGFLKDVRWSSADALADSIASAGNLRVALIRTLADVDRAADLL